MPDPEAGACVDTFCKRLGYVQGVLSIAGGPAITKATEQSDFPYPTLADYIDRHSAKQEFLELNATCVDRDLKGFQQH